MNLALLFYFLYRHLLLEHHTEILIEHQLLLRMLIHNYLLICGKCPLMILLWMRLPFLAVEILVKCTKDVLELQPSRPLSLILLERRLQLNYFKVGAEVAMNDTLCMSHSHNLSTKFIHHFPLLQYVLEY